MDSSCSFGKTLARRVLFLAALLLMGPVTVAIFQAAQATNAAGYRMLATFAWGMDSLGTVLAIWLVARAELWSRWQGYLRAIIYLSAYAYGRMLFSATQDSIIKPDAIFRFPGSQVNDYARPSLDLLYLLTEIWLFLPLMILTGGVLASANESTQRVRRFSISGVIGFTTLAAIVIAWIGYLGSPLAPQTYFSRLSKGQAMTAWLGSQLPLAIPPLISAVVILHGFTRRWWLAPLALGVAFLVDMVGTKILVTLLESATGKQHGGILGGSQLEAILYMAGRTLTVFIAFWIATLAGVRWTYGGKGTSH